MHELHNTFPDSKKAAMMVYSWSRKKKISAREHENRFRDMHLGTERIIQHM